MFARSSLSTFVKTAPVRVWERTLLFLAICSMLAPPAFQAIVTSLLGLWFLIFKGWQPTFKGIQDQQSHSDVYKRILAVLTIGLIFSLIFKSINLFFELLNHHHYGALEIVRSYVKLAGKQGVWGAFLVLGFQFGVSRGWRLEQAAKPLALALTLLALYMLAQRFTGIHWVKGFGGRIPESRFAYEVFRASGFMAHPLTMGYNCMLFTILTFGVAKFSVQAPGYRKYWYLSSLLGFCCLLLTNSRVPIVVTIALLGIPGILLGFRSKKIFVITVILATLGGFAIKDRVLEIHTDPRPWQEKVPRLVFWEVHWDMFRQQPWLGVGYMNKEIVTEQKYIEMGYGDLERKYSAHNIFLQTLADSGLVGFLSLISLLASLGLVAWLSWKHWRIPLLGIIVTSTCASGLMQNNLRDSEFLAALWLSLAICLVVIRENFLATRSEIKNFEP